IALQLSLLPARPWRQGIRGLLPQEAIIFLLIGLGVSGLTQLGTTEWEGITAIPNQASGNIFRQAFWARPEWLYPVVVI
ncbi:hypothetical protein, partial [Salmonella sp. SAL4457]|uniref:hypothetical protein n=1 Tax=Salmonella sp. SAL4457 TaxID=3159912 RepID=UPI00397AD565